MERSTRILKVDSHKQINSPWTPQTSRLECIHYLLLTHEPPHIVAGTVAGIYNIFSSFRKTKEPWGS
ncbi:hypothetical protein MTR67_050820 [Solanum verrucosum]|uniref:Uncharacterized protein n=1 Tax=Solanum verrucosum TaxID=315347 RepID=A0AAF0V3Z2_SOLVR|nr:hypothetical protein MTR67_050820 [Solanum verrucosum]